jgi:hypothetical protein
MRPCSLGVPRAQSCSTRSVTNGPVPSTAKSRRCITRMLASVLPTVVFRPGGRFARSTPRATAVQGPTVHFVIGPVLNTGRIFRCFSLMPWMGDSIYVTLRRHTSDLQTVPVIGALLTFKRPLRPGWVSVCCTQFRFHAGDDPINQMSHWTSVGLPA